MNPGISTKIGTEARMYRSKNCEPGPGFYHTADVVTTKGQKFSTAKRLNTIKKSCDPGPGSYNNNKMAHSKSQGGKIGTASRMQVIGDCTPGPAQYQNFNSPRGKGVKIGTAQRSKSVEKCFSPGPGSYGNNILKKDRTKSAAFGTAPRMRRRDD